MHTRATPLYCRIIADDGERRLKAV